MQGNISCIGGQESIYNMTKSFNLPYGSAFKFVVVTEKTSNSTLLNPTNETLNILLNQLSEKKNFMPINGENTQCDIKPINVEHTHCYNIPTKGGHI